MLKKIIFFSTLSISSVGLAQRHGCPLDNTVFFSYAIDHIKAVEVCYFNNMYRLTYGKITSPDFILMKPSLQVSKIYYGPGFGIRIIDGGNQYDMMGGKFADAILKFNINGNGLYQVLDSRDENFINRVE